MIQVSAPCKIHLLGEWAVVWGKPALLTTVDLRIKTTITPTHHVIARRSPEATDVAISINQDRDAFARDDTKELQKIIETIVKKYLHLKKLPPYHLTINSEAPIGAGLGSSAAVSATYIAALLTFLKVKWDLELINKLAYEAEKVFHGNPSGADNSTITYGGLMWYRKENVDLKIIHSLPFSIPPKLAKNFIIINTGTPTVNTKQMIDRITALFDKKPKLKKEFLESQEQLVRELLPAIKNADQKEVIRIIREGEKNLELIGVCSPTVAKIIRQIEKIGGAAKICGAGAFDGPTGVLLAYHKNQKLLIKLIKSYNLPYFKAKLGVEGLRLES